MTTAVLLIAEAAVIGGAFMMFSKPAPTEAVGMSHELEETEPEATLEEVVIFDGYLGNEATGVAFRYPTRVFLKVDARDRMWIEAEAARSACTIHARLSEIWRSAGRLELDSADLAAIEARVQRAFEQEGLFDRRPAVMPSATTEAADDGHGGGLGGGARGRVRVRRPRDARGRHRPRRHRGDGHRSARQSLNPRRIDLNGSARSGILCRSGR